MYLVVCCASTVINRCHILKAGIQTRQFTFLGFALLSYFMTTLKNVHHVCLHAPCHGLSRLKKFSLFVNNFLSFVSHTHIDPFNVFLNDPFCSLYKMSVNSGKHFSLKPMNICCYRKLIQETLHLKP